MDVIFAKYTRERLPNYQIATYFAVDQGKKIVLKKPLREEAEAHVAKMSETYNWIKTEYDYISLVECNLIDKQVSFEFLEGESLDALLLDAARKNDVHSFNELINSYLSFVRQFGVTKETNAAIKTPFFEVTFLEPLELIKIANIDLIFENLIRYQNAFTMIDYEWVFECAIPLNYLLYRSFLLFYHKHREELGHFISLEEQMEAWQINPSELTVFDSMEKAFQRYVMGNTYEYAYSKQYLQPAQSLTMLKSKLNDSELAMNKLEDDLILQETELEKMKVLNRELAKQANQSLLVQNKLELSLHEEKKKTEELLIRLENQEAKSILLSQVTEQSQDWHDTKNLLEKLLRQLTEKRFLKVLKLNKSESEKSIISNIVADLQRLFDEYLIKNETYEKEIHAKLNHLSVLLHENSGKVDDLTRLTIQQQSEYEKILQQNHVNFVAMQHFKNLYEEQLHVQTLYEELKKSYHEAFQELQKYK
ncbi:hypothetical protein [Paenibacillus sp. UNC499MF]|uniref:hypothetical protein n=1 Tax=Paenibacillus sp. UNC499MF TaxID=1502751 RepID=UPI0008A04CCA|nr:hypothetical protein [Paenibacillus sp. UNC499MF]SEG70486.1 hypothetical protein SAMN02799616_04403 [Paenibacillus sp. UNC499MF]